MKACATADAAIAGALGAAAALCGKIAFDGRAARAFVVRGGAVVGLAAATVCAESVFARALAAADSSLVPTVVSVSTNFVISGLVGIVVLGERVELLWWSAGVALIALGLWLLSTPAQEPPKKKEKDN